MYKVKLSRKDTGASVNHPDSFNTKADAEAYIRSFAEAIEILKKEGLVTDKSIILDLTVIEEN